MFALTEWQINCLIDIKCETVEKQSGPFDIDALVVDDEKDICFLLSGILRKKKFQAKCVNTLKDAERSLSELNPALLFLDNKLPDGYGIEHISKVREKHPYTKIIVITANDTNLDKERALNAGADYFIGKPFHSETIIYAIDSLLSEYHA